MEVKTIFCTQYRLIEGEKFAEMAMNNINSNTFNLSCAAKRCKAKLFIQIRPPILVEVIDSKNLSASGVTKEMLFPTIFPL